MTVLRKSKCGWCNYTYTWWDKLIDQPFMGWLWGNKLANYLYMKPTTWWARNVSRRWHVRFHKQSAMHNPWDGQCVRRNMYEPTLPDARCVVCRSVRGGVELDNFSRPDQGPPT
jgi:hypothetical protein